MERKKRAAIGAGILIFVVGFLVFPVTHEQVIREGTDTFETHYPLFGVRTKEVSDTARNPIYGVGLILANLRHVPQAPSAVIRITVAGKGEVASGTIPVPKSGGDDSTWFSVPAGAIRPGDTYTLAVSAPDSTSANAVGVRFDVETKKLALAVHERVPIWKYIVYWMNAHKDLARIVNTTIIGAVGIALLVYAFEHIPSRFHRHAWIILLCALAAGVVVQRGPLAASMDSAYGGDSFNYLLKSRAWIDGRDPFGADPRKAPLYSFLAMPGFLPWFDPVAAERLVGIVSVAGISIVTALFLRSFGVSYSFAVLGGLLVAVNRDMQFESVQGLSNTLYAFLVLLAAYMFVIGRGYMLAVCSALATLTRYEGAAVIAVLLPASWGIEKKSIRTIVRTIIPVAVLLVLPFLVSPFSHELGVRSVSDITGDEGLYLAYSWDDFASNAISFKHFFGRLWLLTPYIGNPLEALSIGAGLGCIGYVFRNLLQKYAGSIPYILTLIFLTIIIRGNAAESAYLVELVSMLAGFGAAWSVGHTWKKSSTVLLMIALQVVIITIILPKTRYYLPIVPFTAMAIAGTAYILGRTKAGYVGATLLLASIISFTYADASQALPGQVSDINEKSAGQTVLLHAVQSLRRAPGVVAVAEGTDVQARAYLPGSRVIVLPDSLRDVEKQYDALKYSHVEFIINTTENPYFTKLVAEKREKFEPIGEFRTKWASVVSTIYRVY